MPQITRLDDPNCHEVSVVTRGAQKQRFLLTKTDGDSTMDLEKLAKIMEEGELDNEDTLNELLSSVDGIGDSDVTTLKAALRAFGSVADKVPEDVLAKLANAAAGRALDHEVEAEKVDAEPVEDIETDKADDETVEDEEVNKEDFLKEDGTLNVEALPEQVQEELAKAAAASAELEELKKSNDELAKAKDELVEKVETEKWVAKAQSELTHVPGDKEELGKSLRRLAAVDAELAEKIEATLKAANEAISKGALFNEIGGRGPVVEGSAWDEVLQKAEAVMEAKKVTKAVAIDEVLTADPDLYRRYKADKVRS